MQKFKELKYVQRVLVFLLALCIVFAGSSTDAMAKSKKAPAVKSISLKIGKKKVTKKTYKMKPGEKKKIKVSVSPKKGKNMVQFATSNQKVVAVSKKGTVTAKKTGTAKIKVTVKKGASKKKGRMSKKKTTWVKIKIDKASNPKDKTDSDTKPPSDQNTVKGKKSLVVYFSCTNTTSIILAHMLVIMLPYKAPKHGCIFYLPLYSDMWEVKNGVNFGVSGVKEIMKNTKKCLTRVFAFFAFNSAHYFYFHVFCFCFALRGLEWH